MEIQKRYIAYLVFGQAREPDGRAQSQDGGRHVFRTRALGRRLDVRRPLFRSTWLKGKRHQ